MAGITRKQLARAYRQALNDAVTKASVSAAVDAFLADCLAAAGQAQTSLTTTYALPAFASAVRSELTDRGFTTATTGSAVAVDWSDDDGT